MSKSVPRYRIIGVKAILVFEQFLGLARSGVLVTVNEGVHIWLVACRVYWHIDPI